MADTLGGIIDRLCIVNMKLWAVQEIVNRAARDGVGVEAGVVQKLVSLNLDRNRLMTEIDIVLNEACHLGKARVDARVKFS